MQCVVVVLDDDCNNIVVGIVLSTVNASLWGKELLQGHRGACFFNFLELGSMLEKVSLYFATRVYDSGFFLSHSSCRCSGG